MTGAKDGLKDSHGVNWRKDNILNVSWAVEDLGELRLFHKADGRIEAGRIQLSFFDSSRHIGQRHGRMELWEWYMERGIQLRRPYDPLVYVEEQILVI
ncbi:hypothetical protein CAEBREN_01925 [Caenorhabditis brenneri]|uniref:Uncharacterized protein n=1 Tax=Caenorhabditis brenneri TaxID=135651 RepID=G0N2Q8_CAEBE|nr:hypothetical protein CAEBREN_01925 [Caenorhabditis brenneri]